MIDEQGLADLGCIAFLFRKKGYAALPCPVTTNTSAAMQKQLVQVKEGEAGVGG